jgi:hypothetical protein
MIRERILGKKEETMGYSLLRYEKKENFAILTIARPEVLTP